MNESFAAVNRRAIAKAIGDEFKKRTEELLEFQKSYTFADEFNGPPEGPLIAKISEYNKFIDEVVVYGYTFMREQADTAAEIEAAYAYLIGKGMVIA